MTVEHLLSALAGLGIDNCYIELSAPEVPIMDGSAGPFVFLLQSAGIREQEAPKRFIRVKRPVEVREGDKIARFEPHDGFRIGFTVVFDHPAIPASQSRAEVEFSTGLLCKGSESRPYLRLHARPRVHARAQPRPGRARWTTRSCWTNSASSTTTACVTPTSSSATRSSMRWATCTFAGRPIVGAYEGYKSGHALNNKLVRALIAERAAW
jgi:UDP-3-O-[3-hydroxymyristoyl] N-acetylglucosamine deacetylase